jgi:ketosteroid isomerase-like protein
MPSDQQEQILTAIYAAFNARDIDAVLEQLHPEVDWPNPWEGGRAVGHDAVRDYWTRQWAEIDPVATPALFTDREDGTIAVLVNQKVRSADGTEIGVGQVTHIYAFSDGVITRMDIES